MREESKVSIIVPVYNMENTVRRCLNSIQNQTYKNIEIMVINDGSGDSSDIIIRELAETDKRIKYISRPNKGLSLTLKEGIDLSSGEWLMFVDSDDYIDDNIERQKSLFSLSKSVFYRKKPKKIRIFLVSKDMFCYTIYECLRRNLNE